MTTLETARILLAAGVATIPVKADKRPTIKWGRYQTELPTDDDCCRWFSNGASIAIVAGHVQCLDIDVKNQPPGRNIWEEFLARAEQHHLGDILAKTTIQRTQSGGFHVVWSSNSPLPNLKLAETQDHRVMFETRGAGGYFLISPSTGYQLLNGTWETIQELSDDERDTLLALARSFHEAPPAEVLHDVGPDLAPGDDYDSRADVPALLTAHGWTSAGGKYWTRPGKASGISASWDVVPGRFWVFTTSTQFEAQHLYRPWHIFAVLECGGDFREAASKLSRMGYGAPDRKPDRRDIQASKRLAAAKPGAGRATVEDAGAALPPFEDYSQAEAESVETPEVIIQGLMHRGEKATIIGGSKSQKTFCLLQLAVAATCGQKWLGRDVTPGPVLFVNFELQRAWCLKRIVAIQSAMRAEPHHQLRLWHLRGHQVSAWALVDALIERIGSGDYVLVILDPLYKLLQGLNENDAAEMGQLLGELERLVSQRSCGLIYSDHTPKGDLTGRDHIDLASGSGVKARDPDGLVTIRKHAEWTEEDRLYVLESTARNCPPVPTSTVRFDYPCYSLTEVEPALPTIKKGGRPVEIPDAELLRAIDTDDCYDGVTFAKWSDLLGGRIGPRAICKRASDLRRRNLITTIERDGKPLQVITEHGHDSIQKH